MIRGTGLAFGMPETRFGVWGVWDVEVKVIPVLGSYMVLVPGTWYNTYNTRWELGTCL